MAQVPGPSAKVAPKSPWVSYRLSLVIAIPLLVVITSGMLALQNYAASRASLRKLAAALFARIAEQTAQQATDHLQQATPAVELLTSYIAEEPRRPGDVDIATRMAAVLRTNPGFTWASFGGADGSSVSVRRIEGDPHLIVSRSHLEASGPVRVQKMILDDGSWVDPPPTQTTSLVPLDPRTRPFYLAAVKAGRRVWTEPYVFGRGVPGITCAEPAYARSGELRGVVTIDFDLNSLSAFVASLQTTPNTRVFIAAESGTIIAHSGVHLDRGASQLVTRETIADDLVREHYAARDRPSFLHQTADGTHTYFAATHAFKPDAGIDWYVAVVAPASDLLADSNRALRFSLLVSLAGVILAVLVAATLASRVARPLVLISREMDRVGRFELDLGDPPPSAFKEIAQMNRALTAMKTGLSSFALYVPRDLVRRVLSRGEKAILGGETRRMTIFFSDLAGFTSLSEAIEPKELVLLLGGYFDEMTKVVARNRGTVDKFIGDGIMAFWNAPEEERDHASLACIAAIESQRRLEEMKATDPAIANISARIGIATGDVLVGNIGSHERMNYTVMGDTANLAARLEGLGKVYGTGILVSEATYQDARSQVVMRAVDVVAVKGRKAGVRVYEPIGLRDDASPGSLRPRRAVGRGARRLRLEALRRGQGEVRRPAEGAPGRQGDADHAPADRGLRVHGTRVELERRVRGDREVSGGVPAAANLA